MAQPGRGGAGDTEVAHEIPRGPHPAGTRGRAIAVVGVVLALTAAQLVWKATLLRHAYFIEDDYVYIARAAHQSLNWDYLMKNYNGQLMPGGFALVWVLTHASLYGWGLASAVTLAMQAVASLALAYALYVLFGARPLVLIPFALYSLTPLTVPALTWWAVSLNVVPTQIAISMAVAAHVRAMRGEGTRYAVYAGLWVAFGMAFYVKGAFIPFLLFALSAACFFSGPWRARAVEALRTHRDIWVGYAAVLVAEIAVYIAQLHTSHAHVIRPTAGEAVKFTLKLVGETFVLYPVGGPWHWRQSGVDYASPQPVTGQVVLAWLVMIVLVAASLRYRRDAHWPWLIVLGWVVIADAVPVLIGRTSLVGSDLGLESRYVADAAPVLAICLALAYLPLLGEHDAYLAPWPQAPGLTALGGLLGGAVAVASLWSVHSYQQHLGDLRGRAFVHTAKATLARQPSSSAIQPSMVPKFMMLGVFGNRALTTNVITPLAPPKLRATMRLQPATEHPLVFDDHGRLRPAKVAGITSAPPPNGAFCWNTMRSTVRIPLRDKTPAKQWTISMGYLTSKPTNVTVGFGHGTARVPLERKLGRVTFPIKGGGRSVWVGVPNLGPHVCVTDLAVGFAVPAR